MSLPVSIILYCILCAHNFLSNKSNRKNTMNCRLVSLQYHYVCHNKDIVFLSFVSFPHPNETYSFDPPVYSGSKDDMHVPVLYTFLQPQWTHSQSVCWFARILNDKSYILCMFSISSWYPVVHIPLLNSVIVTNMPKYNWLDTCKLIDCEWILIC